MKPPFCKTLTKQPVWVLAMGAAWLALPIGSRADSSYTINNTTADAFLARGSAGNPLGSDLTSLNFGGAGTLAIAPASSTKGEFDSVLKFNSAAAISQFNGTYGPGNWQITGLTLTLASNFGAQGEQPNSTVFNTINAGSFGLDWLANDSWVEGTGGGNGTPGYPNNSSVTYDSIPTLFSSGYDSLGTYHYAPPGDNVYANYALTLDAGLVSHVAAGGDVSLYLYAADDQVSYLFNSRSYSANHPELTLTAAPIPEPCGLMWLGTAFGACRAWRQRKPRP